MRLKEHSSTRTWSSAWWYCHGLLSSELQQSAVHLAENLRCTSASHRSWAVEKLGILLHKLHWPGLASDAHRLQALLQEELRSWRAPTLLKTTMASLVKTFRCSSHTQPREDANFGFVKWWLLDILFEFISLSSASSKGGVGRCCAEEGPLRGRVRKSKRQKRDRHHDKKAEPHKERNFVV